MQWKSTWLLLALFVVGIMSLSIVGCGSDDTGTPGEPAVTTPSTDTPVEVASITPIDYEAEKEGIQKVYSDFYRAFNAKRMTDLRKTIYESNGTEFSAVWWVGGFPEQVGPTHGWNQIKATIGSLWSHTSTSGQKWTGSNRFSEFWIRRKKSNPNELEATAKAYASYRTQGGSGITYAVLVKNKNKDWLIQQIEGITQNTVNNRGSKPSITRYFFDPSAKVK